MLTEGGDYLKLADFGLALNLDEISKEDAMDEAGTPYYTGECLYYYHTILLLVILTCLLYST